MSGQLRVERHRVNAHGVDLGPFFSSRDFADARKRKGSKRRKGDDEDEDDDPLRGLGSLPRVPSVQKARIAHELNQISWMEEDDERPASKRFSHDLKDDDDRACVPREPEPGEDRMIMDTYLEQRSKRMQAEVVVEEAMEDEEEAKDQSVEDRADALYARMRNLAAAEREDALERQRIHTRVNLATDKLAGRKIKKGDLILAKIRKCLNEMGYTRSQFQELFHNKFICSCLPHIYGAEWAECSERVMKEFGINRIRFECLVQTYVEHQ